MKKMTANQLIAAAAAEIGAKGSVESPRGSNNVKYNTAYYGGKVNDSTLHWCVAFIWWLFNVAFDAKMMFCGGNKTASCTYVKSWAVSHGQWVTKDFRPGDLVIFDWNADGVTDHIGVIEKVNADGSLDTIEGNVSDKVGRAHREKKHIMGAYRPTYEPEQVKDVFAEAKAWAIESKIFSGDGKGNYNWDKPLTREQAAQILYNFANK